MKPLTNEWIQKAEGDFATAGRELRARSDPNYDAVCFHAQQTAEKYLKASLQEWGQPIPRTHNLIDLLALCLKADPTFAIIQPDLTLLNSYAVQFRYPGQTAEKPEAKAAYESAKAVRAFIKNKLTLLS